MSDLDLADLVPSLSEPDRIPLVMRYWRRGELTPLPIANSVARTAGATRSLVTRKVA
jgi:hypothetical protein